MQKEELGRLVSIQVIFSMKQLISSLIIKVSEEYVVSEGKGVFWYFRWVRGANTLIKSLPTHVQLLIKSSQPADVVIGSSALGLKAHKLVRERKRLTLCSVSRSNLELVDLNFAYYCEVQKYFFDISVMFIWKDCDRFLLHNKLTCLLLRNWVVLYCRLYWFKGINFQNFSQNNGISSSRRVNYWFWYKQNNVKCYADLFFSVDLHCSLK